MALVLDFDGTITMQDTIEVLAQFGVRWQKEHGRDLSDAWKDIAAKYGDDYEEYRVRYPVPESQRVSLPVEAEFRNGMKELEMASIRRVHESRLFEGVQISDFRAAGEEAVKNGEVNIRNGLHELIATARACGWSIYVISVNWSKAFIEGALSGFGPGIRVISNEIMSGKISGPILSTDTNTPIMTTSADKASVLHHSIPEAEKSCLVYFGDSTNDLECMTLSTGVVISTTHDSSLLKTLSRIGFQVRHVNDGPCEDQLVWARDFFEVVRSGLVESLDLSCETRV